ncbi:MAG: ATP synthase F1 subunit gamma [Phycisphaerales bacterium]
MAQIREIKKRMVAVGTIQRITKTMQMIATAKFTAAFQRAQATKPYTGRIRELVQELSANSGDVEHPLLRTESVAGGRELLLVISSDRGLCGAYNANVLRNALQHLRSRKEGGEETTVEISGKKAVGFFRFAKIDVAEHHTFGDTPAYDDVDAIATRYMNAFIAGEYDAVRVAYMRFESNSRQRPEVQQLLPLSAEPADAADAGDGAGASAATYEFSPSAESLLASMLPLTVKSQLFQCVNDAVVSEQIMRMVAMKAATENAKDLKKNLGRKFNRARQAQITTELTEIISGAAALE